MYAAGELAMTARDLAAWDVSMIERSVMKPSSYREMETEVVLANGVGARYGLGVSVGTADGHRVVSHGGEVSGFTAQNQVYPDDRAAIVVCTNLDATGASSQIASRIAALLFTANNADTRRAVEQARAIFEDLQQGRIDRSLLTDNLNAYFTPEAMKDFQTSLGPLGKPSAFVQSGQSLRGGMVLRRFQIGFPGKTLSLTTFTMPDGKLEQYLVAAVD